MGFMKNSILSTLIIIPFFVLSQTDEKVISDIYTNSLTNGQSYSWLDYLSNNIGSRLSGSLGAEKAVAWTKEELETLGLDKVWLQPVMVPKWVRGVPEFAYIETSPGKYYQGKYLCFGRFNINPFNRFES